MNKIKVAEIIKIQQMIHELDAYMKKLRESIDNLKFKSCTNILAEKIKGYRVPMHPQVVSKIANLPNKSPEEKQAIAREFTRRKLQQQQLQNMVKGAGEQMSVDEYEISVVNAMSGANPPYKIVPDASYNQSSKLSKTP